VSETTLYPLRFEPIFQYRLWGGRRLSNLLSAPLPDGPVGEAWILSDRDDHPSHVANGPLKGRTLGEVMQQSQKQLMGRLAMRFQRFPLLLKFLDVSEMLSIQVHPSDKHPELIPAGETSKTEAWVVIEAHKGCRIYAGLQPGETRADLHSALAGGKIAERLLAIDPKRGDAIFIPAGTVHTLGDDIVVFEVQQNSDVTFRLYDWGHIDSKTGQPRPLQVDQAFASIDFDGSTGGLVMPIVEATAPVVSERLFDCDHFRLWRLHGVAPFSVGVTGVPRVLVCIQGSGHVEHNNIRYAIGKGDVWLFPAEIGVCPFQPAEEATLLEIAIPE
jgi:mannose-6-phosphate isomerase